MNMTLKELIRLVTPPLLIQVARRLRNGHTRAGWEYIPEGWGYAEQHPEVRGWNVEEVLNIYKEKWPTFAAMVQNKGPLGVAHESALTTNDDIAAHNTMMALAYTLALAARQKDRLSILDWGGGIGHYFLIAKELLPDVEIEYHCKDVPLLAEYGAELFPTQHFYDDESCLTRAYDCVIVSGSLHYSINWQETLRSLANAASDYLFVTRLPTVTQSDSYVFVQRPYAYGYNTEYLGWCLNREEVLASAIESGCVLQREFIIGERPNIVNAPAQCQYRGFLFRKSTFTT